MDQLDALIAIAQLRLRLIMLERSPELLDMEIKRPIELAGLKSRLLRAKKQETEIGDLGRRYDKVMDDIDESKDAGKQHVGYMEEYHSDLKKTIEGMVGSNNPTDGQDGPPGDEVVPK